MVRGMEVNKAFATLPFIPKKGAPILHKVLKSAVANALTNENIRVHQDELYISKLMINEAPRLKRWRAISRGRAVLYYHRFSHIIMELDNMENISKKKK